MTEHVPTQELSMPTAGPERAADSAVGDSARRDLIIAAVLAAAILAVGVYRFLKQTEAASFRGDPSATGAALPSGSCAGSVDADNGKNRNRSAPCYRWRNSATGEQKITSSPTSPGPGWSPD
jgi:hypothetical protein